ncbi:exonuclease domain-containing protein [Streptomyces sp. NPDC058619]|uniref:exonuclease domain-containing protein n=1 Tax=unclassified Streptomyces TaxID=2593676 RepID=UPI003660208A
MKLTDFRRVGWDTETTGTNPQEDRIVTAAIVVRGGGRPDMDFTYTINPGIPIPEAASGIHGVTDAMVQAEGRDPKVALDEIASHLTAALKWRMPVVAFNQSFDWSILHYELVRNGLATVEDRLGEQPECLLDPHVLDRQFDRYVKGKGQRQLQPTAERYGVKLTDWHEAKADALAALLIAEKQFERFPILGDYAPGSLFTQQQRWRADQQAELQAHFRKTDPTAVVRGEWPLLPIPHQQDGDQ